MFFFGSRLSVLIGPSDVHKFLNVKSNEHTLCLYNVQNKHENKQYGTSFEVTTPKLSSCFLFIVLKFLNNTIIQVHGSLNN
jgi:hypothetical protein